MSTLEEFIRRVDQGWVPFGWHIAYPDVRLEFDGESECGDPVWERNANWGLTPTELEADSNAALGRAWGTELTDQEAADFVQTVMETPPGMVSTLPPFIQVTLPHPHLVDIHPVPMRIVPGVLYADRDQNLYRGIHDGQVRVLSGDCSQVFLGTDLVELRAVKVVDA